MRDLQKKRDTQKAYALTPDGREVHRRKILKHRYNLTPEQWDEILEAQGGTCAICPATESQRGRRFSVDHDHACCPGPRSCGRCVRGLLCLRCNNALGWYETHMSRVDAYLAMPLD